GGLRQVQLTWNPPAPVTNVTVSQPARSVTVSQPVGSVTIYQGQAQDNGQPPKVSDGQPASVSEATDKSAVVIGLTTGIQYYFWLVRGQAVVSDQVPAAPVKQATTPGAPIGLAATPSDGQVSLKWNPPVPNGGPDVTGYNVYYATSADFKAATK